MRWYWLKLRNARQRSPVLAEQPPALRISVSIEIEYAIAALVFYGLSDLVYKRAAATGIRADHFLMVQGWVFTPLVILYGLVSHTLVLKLAGLWGSLAGVFAFIGFYNFFRSLSRGSVSTNAAIFRLSFVVTASLAIVFLGEPPTPSKLTGLTLALFATWLLIGGEDRPYGQPHPASLASLAQVLVATLAFGAAMFCHTVALRQGVSPATTVAAQATMFTPLAMTFVYIADGKVAPPKAAWPYASSTAVLLLIAFLLLLRGVTLGEASVLVPIAQMSFVVTAIVGIIVLKEPFNSRKAIGFIAAFAALAVLATS
jgi:drug/metabolite transporter (DMT)-like permease